MDKYYYLVAQLPTLVFDRDPPLDVDGFLAECEKWVSARDLAVLSEMHLSDTEGEAPGPGVVQEYRAFEKALRGDVAEYRRHRGSDQEYRPSAFPLSAVREGTPLDVERRLLRLRWDTIEELEQAHHFDLGILVLYMLKLQILRRLSTFDREEGLKTFQNLCEVEV